MTVAHDHATVLRFWFEEAEPVQHWRADPVFDELIRARFGTLHLAAVQAELSAWRVQPAGRLAEVIVLDQFSRNIHRGTAAAFATDPMALALAQKAMAGGHDRALPPERLLFLYMPFMHSESRRVHEQAVPLFTALGLASNLDFEMRHKAIIDRFGRYPHRNAILGRGSTEDEGLFLQQPGSSF